jgi:two-component system, chemotaxis family, response regulator WspF
MKIGIVNDRPLAVEALRRALSLKPEHEVLWTAKDGAEAVECCVRATPDLVLMDLIMPGMDGVEATRRIMATAPCPILVVTSSVGVNASRAFEAMGHGALDAVDTPAIGAGDAREKAAPLLRKIDTIERLLAERRPGGTMLRARVTHRVGGELLVAIGASAGGPTALATLLRALPKDFPAALAIVQHVDAQFAPGMAEWLTEQSPMNVRVAVAGDRLTAGSVVLAGTSDHLVLTTRQQLAYVSKPRDCAYRPSIDVFFESVCQYWPGEAIGVLLTGMGRDGALGLKALRNQGRYTVAQDQATSAVYGMPKAAAKLQAAVDILPLDRIADRLLDHCAARMEKVQGRDV